MKLLIANKAFIVFRGRLKSGKSTAAKYLETKFSNVKRLAFADSLKEEVYDLLWRSNGLRSPNTDEDLKFVQRYFAKQPDFAGLDIVPDNSKRGLDLYYVSLEEKRQFIDAFKDKLRPLLQFYGTEYRRSQNENYWVGRFLARALYYIEKDFIIAVDDCRFPNELEALNKCGAVDIWVLNTELGEPEGITGHASEAMDSTGAQFGIENVPSLGLEEYHLRIDCLVETLGRHIGCCI